MSRQREFPDVAIIIGLRVKSVERGRKTGATGMVPLTASWWDEHRDRRNHPSSQVVIRRFGGWTKACAAAGIPVRDLPNVGRPQRWTDEEMLAHLAEFLQSPRRKDKTFLGYSQWAKLRKARPSGPTLIKRFGSWSRAKDLALR